MDRHHDVDTDNLDRPGLQLVPTPERNGSDIKQDLEGPQDDLAAPRQEADKFDSELSLQRQKNQEYQFQGNGLTDRMARFVELPAFEGFTGCLILANTLVMMVETQYVGVVSGYETGLPLFE